LRCHNYGPHTHGSWKPLLLDYTSDLFTHNDGADDDDDDFDNNDEDDVCELISQMCCSHMSQFRNMEM
jgi:hypothetical protein